MVGHARRLLAHIQPVAITLGRVLYHPRAIMLDASPREALVPVLSACQDATRVATGRNGELYSEPWAPHITIAYGNSACPAAPAIEALGRRLPPSAVMVTSVSLVHQTPAQRWMWDLVAHVPLADGLHSVTEDLSA